MNRRHALATTSFMVLGLALGVATTAHAMPDSPKPDKLVAIVSSTFGPMMETFAPQWTEKTGVPVEVISQSYDTTYTKIVTSIVGGAQTDIVVTDSIWTSGFAQAGFIRPLQDEVGSFEDRLVPVAIDQRKVDGTIYSMPITNEAKFFYYNEELLNEAGYDAPPATWEELIAMSEDMREQGVAEHGILWGWHQAEGLICDYVLLVNGFGGEIIDADGNWRFHEGGGLRALEFMVETLESGIADPSSVGLSDRQVVDSYNAGNVPFMLNWSFALSATNNPETSNIVGKVRVGKIPGFEEAGTVSTSVTGGSGFAVTASSQHPDWAWDLVHFLTDVERQIQLQEVRSNMPVWKEIYDHERIVAEYPYVGQMAEQFDYAVWRPNLPNYAEVSSLLQLYVHRALTGSMSPKEALDQAYEEISRL